MAEIIKNLLLEKSYTSLYGFWHIDDSWISNMIHGVNHYDAELGRVLKDNSSILPLHVNADAVHRINPIQVEEQDRFIYKDTYFSIVTETIFFHDRLDPIVGEMISSIFVTEKTYKPIAAKHPFIILSVPYFLKHLKSIGFKTFHPFINEDYDNEIDDMKRFNMIVNEMNRLCKFSDQEWLSWQENVKEIVDYNYEFFYNTIKPGLNDLTNIIKILEE